MGKRSRARSGAVKGVSNAPAASKRAAASSGADTTSVVGRAKTSWKAAGAVAPGVVKEPGRVPRTDRPTRRTGRQRRGERPAALWGRAPISEFAILAGTIVLVVGMLRGPAKAGGTLTGGLVLITIAVLEFAGREHVRGYRSHTLFLSMIIVIVVHFAIGFAVGAHTARSPVFFGLDVVLFGVLATALSKQFSIARLKAAPDRSR